MSAADAVLERRYRRLLLAFPGRFRRGRGTEIVTTLLEMAEPGQRRPALADAWHLMVSGVRQRFRLPARRPLAWVAAVVLALIAGAFGAAAGSWVAEQTFTDLPDDAQVVALNQVVGGAGDQVDLTRVASPWWTTMLQSTLERPGWTPEEAQARLTAAGWRVTSIEPLSGMAVGPDDKPLPFRGSAFEAGRGGLRIHVMGFVSPGHGNVTIDYRPADTGALRPAVIAGALIGLLAGWLIAAAGAYRMRSAGRAYRRAVATLTVLAVAALAAPTVAIAANVKRVFEPGTEGVVFTVHSALSTAGAYWSYGSEWMILQLTGIGLALAALAWVLLAWTSSSRHADPEPTTDRQPA